eukprot:s44_g15.t2
MSSHATLPKLQIKIRSILSGDVLADLQVTAAESLQAAAESKLPDLVPFQLVHGAVNCAQSTAEEIGLDDGAVLDLVRVRKTRALVSHPRNFSLRGFHCHDSYLDRVASEDPQAFYISFVRVNLEDSTDSRDQSHDRGCRDTVYVDAVSAKPVDHKRSRPKNGRVVPRGREPDVFYCSKGPIGHRCRLHWIARDGTMYGSTTSREHHDQLWSTTDGVNFEKIGAESPFRVSDCLLVGDSLFVLGESKDSWRLLQLGRDPEGQFVERRVQTELRGDRRHRRVRPKILGLDETGHALWLCLEHGLLVLPLETLAPRLCFTWNDFREACPQEKKVEFEEVLMDLRTRELYVFFDDSLVVNREDMDEAGAASCRVLCVAPQPKRRRTSLAGGLSGPGWRSCVRRATGNRRFLSSFLHPGNAPHRSLPLGSRRRRRAVENGTVR